VFDLSRTETFQSVLKWKREIDSKVTLPNGRPLPVFLLANKCDLPDTRVDKGEYSFMNRTRSM
jgi:GTPase SAR1 family protein